VSEVAVGVGSVFIIVGVDLGIVATGLVLVGLGVGLISVTDGDGSSPVITDGEGPSLVIFSVETDSPDGLLHPTRISILSSIRPENKRFM